MLFRQCSFSHFKNVFFSSLEKRSQSFIRIHSSFTLELPQTCFRMHFGQTPRTLQNEPRVVLKKATQDQECATSCPLMCIPFDSRLCFFPPRLEVTAWLLFISPLTGEALVNSDSLSPVCSSILSQPTQCAALSPEPRWLVQLPRATRQTDAFSRPAPWIMRSVCLTNTFTQASFSPMSISLDILGKIEGRSLRHVFVQLGQRIGRTNYLCRLKISF